MIKVNLCPVEELESPYWYVPDLTMALGIALAGYFAVNYYLGHLRDNLNESRQKIASLEASIQQLEPELQRFKTLDEDIKMLNDKLNAIQSITVSKIAKFKPLIILEHLQNIKPMGVWYQTLDIGLPTEESFKVKGQSLDNLLIAEFMMALRSTQDQEIETSDLRTHVYFRDLVFSGSRILPGPVAKFTDLKDLPAFEISGVIASHPVADAPVPETQPTQNKVSHNHFDKGHPSEGRL